MQTMIAQSPEHVAAATGLAAIFGLSALWLFIKKTMLRSAVDTVHTKAADAQTEVIQLLRDEVRRLSEINQVLAENQNKFQLENMRLKRQVSDLHAVVAEMSEKLKFISVREHHPHINEERRE
jgi:hypothetical protein